MYASTGSVTLSAPANARRVTVVAPTTRVDVALPAESAIAEIVPQLAGLAGLASHDPTGIAEGWLLSRLGNEPFEPARSVAASGIRDGELLYLTPRSEQLPPALFDDMIEAVAHAADGLPGTWRPSTTRRTGLLVATLCLFAGLALLTWSGLPAEIAAVTTAVLTVLLLTAAGLVSRAVGDGSTGALIAIIALPYSAFAALLGIAGGGRQGLGRPARAAGRGVPRRRRHDGDRPPGHRPWTRAVRGRGRLLADRHPGHVRRGDERHQRDGDPLRGSDHGCTGHGDRPRPADARAQVGQAPPARGPCRRGGVPERPPEHQAGRGVPVDPASHGMPHRAARRQRAHGAGLRPGPVGRKRPLAHRPRCSPGGLRAAADAGASAPS